MSNGVICEQLAHSLLTQRKDDCIIRLFLSVILVLNLYVELKGHEVLTVV